ncbi:MAG: patatin-like phospholipase family protein [Thermodesulfobacteriota bacterium]
MKTNIILKAGKKALARIRDGGLHADDVKVMAGAAGGPKWLILGHLDRYLFRSFFKLRKEPLYLIGSSSGAWRFAAVSQADPLAAIQRYEDAYIGQTYDDIPTPAEVSAEAGKIVTHLLGKQGADEILSHPFLRLNFMTARGKGYAGSEQRFKLFIGLSMAVLGNFISRRFLGWFFERGLFHDARDMPPFAGMQGLPMQGIALTLDNLHDGLLASGSIPWVMNGVTNIPGAPRGVYRDGGVIDYHMDIPFLDRQDGIVLYPHYQERVVPGWLDKKIPWRRPHAAHMENVLLLAPSPAFVESLPDKKIPDRNDFYTYKGQDKERIDTWKQSVKTSRRLADEFVDAVESGKIKQIVQLLKF